MQHHLHSRDVHTLGVQSLVASLKQLRPFACQLDYQLSEQSVGPGKPRPGIVRRIVGIDALMDQSQSIGTRKNHLDLVCDFIVIVRGECPYDSRHGPCVAWTIVRTSYGADHRASCPVRVLQGE